MLPLEVRVVELQPVLRPRPTALHADALVRVAVVPRAERARPSAAAVPRGAAGELRAVLRAVPVLRDAAALLERAADRVRAGERDDLAVGEPHASEDVSEGNCPYKATS